MGLMSDLEIKIINTKHALYSAEQQLRNNVLLIPYGLPPHFWEMNDKSSFHIVTIDKENNVVGCLLLYPLPNELDSVQLMQMAVSKECQGKGVGRKMVNFAKDLSMKHGFERITCHAREYAAEFYLKLQFTEFGERFEEVGMPHRNMEWRCSTQFELFIANRRYSSWSMRAWLLLRASQLPFDSHRLTLFSTTNAEWREKVMQVS